MKEKEREKRKEKGREKKKEKRKGKKREKNKRKGKEKERKENCKQCGIKIHYKAVLVLPDSSELIAIEELTEVFIVVAVSTVVILIKGSR